MSLRERILDYSLGNDLRWFWRLYRLRANAGSPWTKRIAWFFFNRSAHRHGGYVGDGARIDGVPSLPHGIHGIYISRYARVGEGCRIYQNVTIGEVDGQAPTIGKGCLIGANACLVGGIVVGDGAKIGAGAVVARDVPAGSTVVAQPARILQKELP